MVFHNLKLSRNNPKKNKNQLQGIMLWSIPGLQVPNLGAVGNKYSHHGFAALSYINTCDNEQTPRLLSIVYTDACKIE